VGDAVVRDFLDGIGCHPVVLEGELEKSMQYPPPIVDGFWAGIPTLADLGELLGRELGYKHTGKTFHENFQLAADVIVLGDREQILIMLPLLERDVVSAVT
jgi:hypothetical protein